MSAIHWTIDVFGTGCGLIACKPWPRQFTPAVARDKKALKRLEAPSVGKDEALRKLRAYWSRIGFWPLGNTGIYLLSVSQRGSKSAPGIAGLAFVDSQGRLPTGPVRTLPCHGSARAQSISSPLFPREARSRPSTILRHRLRYPAHGTAAIRVAWLTVSSGRDRCEWTSIPNLLSCRRHKIIRCRRSHVLI